MKTLSILFLLITGLVMSPASQAASPEDQSSLASASGPVTLRENIMVSGSYITLGDLFDNVPADKMQTSVAYAPKPGRRASFDARWLYRVARAYRLQWRPLSNDLRATVSRDSIIIDREEIAEAIMASLTQFNLPQNADLHLSNRQLRLHVSSDIMPEIRIDDVVYNERSNRFAAIVAVGEKGMNANQRVRVTGQVLEMVDVPTLAHHVARDAVITAGDITWIKQRADRIQRDAILDVESLIGMSPKRVIRPERPIRAVDIQSPTLVEKGSLVTIILKKPGMTLTAQGKALQHGADGDTIRIINNKTKRTIEAVVIGSSMVTVLPGISKTAQLAYTQ